MPTESDALTKILELARCRLGKLPVRQRVQRSFIQSGIRDCEEAQRRLRDFSQDRSEIHYLVVRALQEFSAGDLWDQ